MLRCVIGVNLWDVSNALKSFIRA